MRDLNGLLVPVPAAFVDDTSGLSEVRLVRLARWYREQGATGFVLNSDLGEFTSLSMDERMQVVEILQRETQGQVPLLVHISTLSTTQSLYLAQHASRCGARAAILMAPYYYRLRDDELINFFGTVAEHADVPILVVDPVGLITVGVKESLQDVGGVLFVTPLHDSKLGHLSLRQKTASDEFLIEDAYCSALAAWNPQAVLQKHTKLEAMRQLMKAGGSLRVIKAVLNYMERDVGPTRGPFMELQDEHRTQMRAILD